MIVIGTLIRGPGWMWFWPGVTWDHNRLIFEVNRDLPDLFGIKGRIGKTIFGAIVVALYFVAAGIGMHKLITVHAVQSQDPGAHEPAAIRRPCRSS